MKGKTMKKIEFEKLFADAAEKNGVASAARLHNFAPNLEGMMIELRNKLNSLPAEQPSEDLEEAAKEYIKENCILPEDCHDGDVPYYQKCTASVFKDGANWQKEQMLKSAIDAKIVNDESSGCVVDCEQGCLVLEPNRYLIGQKLKILIVKEEQ